MLQDAEAPAGGIGYNRREMREQREDGEGRVCAVEINICCRG